MKKTKPNKEVLSAIKKADREVGDYFTRKVLKDLFYKDVDLKSEKGS